MSDVPWWYPGIVQGVIDHVTNGRYEHHMTEKTTPATFEPDWEQLTVAALGATQAGEPLTWATFETTVQVVITALREQERVAGKVVVDRDAVKRVNDFLHVFDDRPFHLSKVETIPEYEQWFSDIEAAWDRVSEADWDHLELAANEGEGRDG